MIKFVKSKEAQERIIKDLKELVSPSRAVCWRQIRLTWAPQIKLAGSENIPLLPFRVYEHINRRSFRDIHQLQNYVTPGETSPEISFKMPVDKQA